MNWHSVLETWDWTFKIFVTIAGMVGIFIGIPMLTCFLCSFLKAFIKGLLKE